MMFKNQVKSARVQLKLSQTAFAKELNVSFTSLNRWENGRTEPQPAVKDVFYSYCKKCNIVFEEGEDCLSDRDDIILIVDEAHRSQYGLEEKVNKDEKRQ